MQMMSEASWVAIGIAFAGFLGNLLIWRVTAARMEGAVVARLDGHDDDIAELKKSRGDQWTKINRMDREIGEVKSNCRAKHSNGHTTLGAGGL